MIRLTRSGSIPSVLSPKSRRRRRAEESILARVESRDVLQSKHFRALWSDEVVRKKLSAMHNNRCCYCERFRDSSRESDIEHFRPKTAVAEKVPNRPGYWWLAYEWTNLLFSCKTCNEQYKKTHFPVRGTRAVSPDDSLNEEQACLLDPASEDVDSAIGFDWVTHRGNVLVYGIGSNVRRATTTVRIVGLNRPSLASERWEALQPLKRIARSMIRAQEEGVSQSYISRVAEEIQKMTSRSSAAPFVGMKRKFFQAFDLGEFVSTD